MGSKGRTRFNCPDHSRQALFLVTPEGLEVVCALCDEKHLASWATIERLRREAEQRAEHERVQSNG